MVFKSVRIYEIIGTSLGGQSISFQCLVVGKLGDVSRLAGGTASCGCRKSGMQQAEAQDESAGRTAAIASDCRCFQNHGLGRGVLGLGVSNAEMQHE